MEYRLIKTFKAVADLSSFHRAAEALHYAQSTVSAQIQDLEDELGVRLFDRLGRRIMLTEAGERLLNYAQKMLDLEEEARAEVMGDKQVQGSLTIRVPESFITYRLPPVIRRFRSLLPKVRLHFITCTVEGLHKDLQKGVVDLAFLLTDSIQAGDLQMEALGVESLVMVGAPDHPMAGVDRLETGFLTGETILLSRVDCSYRRLFEEILAEENVNPEMTLELHNVAAIKRCAAAGLGITIIPEVSVREEVARGELAVLPWAEGGLEIASLMIWHQDKWLSPSLKVFMKVTRQFICDEQQSGNAIS